jgi:hypothetical protein
MNHMPNQTSRNVHAISAQTGAVVNMFLHFARTKMRDALTGRERTCTTALLTLREFIAYVLNIEPWSQKCSMSIIRESTKTLTPSLVQKNARYSNTILHQRICTSLRARHSITLPLRPCTFMQKPQMQKKGNVPPIPQLRSIFSRTYVVEKEERLVFLYGAGNGRLFIA